MSLLISLFTLYYLLCALSRPVRVCVCVSRVTRALLVFAPGAMKVDNDACRCLLGRGAEVANDTEQEKKSDS